MAPSHGAEADGKWPELPLALLKGSKTSNPAVQLTEKILTSLLTSNHLQVRYTSRQRVTLVDRFVWIDTREARSLSHSRLLTFQNHYDTRV